MSIKDMEHMDMEWECLRSEGRFVVAAVGGRDWFVCEPCLALSGCESGEATARAICDEHNAALAARKAAK